VPVYINILSALYVIVDEISRYAAYCWSSGRWATPIVADSPRRSMRKLVTFGTVATTFAFCDSIRSGFTSPLNAQVGNVWYRGYHLCLLGHPAANVDALCRSPSDSRANGRTSS
jgi:hypothetical protein